MRILTLCCLVLVSTAPASAQSQDRTERIVRAWSDWVETGGTDVAAIAVMRSGEIVASEGIGIAPDAALPLASLSKAITAACVVRLPVADGLSMETTADSLIADVGPAGERTVGQLLTHTGGIGPDSTQSDASLRDNTSPQTEAVAMRALARDPQGGEIGTYAYNSENYAIVGRMIEVATGRSYAEACAEAVLRPLDIRTGTLAGE